MNGTAENPYFALIHGQEVRQSAIDRQPRLVQEVIDTIKRGSRCVGQYSLLEPGELYWRLNRDSAE